MVRRYFSAAPLQTTKVSGAPSVNIIIIIIIELSLIDSRKFDPELSNEEIREKKFKEEISSPHLFYCVL